MCVEELREIATPIHLRGNRYREYYRNMRPFLSVRLYAFATQTLCGDSRTINIEVLARVECHGAVSAHMEILQYKEWTDIKL